MDRAALRVAGYRFRATFRRRWGGYVALVAVIALVGGLAMGAVAGARRTQSSFPTYALIVVGALLLGNIVATFPAPIAARTLTALFLRAERGARKTWTP